MSVNLLDSLSKNRSTKDQIVSVLSEEWPLSVKQIFGKVKKHSNRRVTYQAIHKALKELEDAKILASDNRNYSLNFQWIEEMEKFASSIKKKYLKQDGLIESYSNIVLNSVSEVDLFFLNTLKQMIKSQNGVQKPLLCLQWCHYWVPLFLDKKIYQEFREIVNYLNVYDLVSNNTPVDKWCEGFWKKAGLNTMAGIKATNLDDYLIFGDYVIQVYYPKEILNEISKTFEKAKKVEDINWNRFYENVFERKTQIPVTINRNPPLASMLREQILAHFNGNKKNKVISKIGLINQ